jgi:hypothetical protein
MKGGLYTLGKTIALTAVMAFLVIAPYQPLTAQAQVGAETSASQVAPAQINTGVNSAQQGTGDIFAACKNLNFSGCVTSILYAFTVGIGSTFAYIAVYFFNVTVQLSLNGSAYGLDFISTSWTTARDLANMAFLFILLFIAFQIIFRADTSGTMSLLAGVIIVALLVNFSFFFTRVVIDAGNILSIQFYNSIPAPSLATSLNNGGAVGSTPTSIGNGINSAATALGAGTTKDLTAGIMNMLQVQSLLNQNSFQAAQGSTIATIFLFIAIAIVLWLLTVVFITAGVKFLFRIVVLWFLIIASPLAFIAAAVQGMNGGYFKQWRDLLFNHAFYPVAFLFIFLILNNFAVSIGSNVGSVFATLPTGANATWGAIGASLVSIAIRLGLVIGVLFVGLKLSDKISVMGAKYAEKAGNFMGMGLLKSYNVGYKRIGPGAAVGALDRSLQKGVLSKVGNSTLGFELRRYVTKPLANTRIPGAHGESNPEMKTRQDKENKEKGANMSERSAYLRDKDNKAVIAQAPTIEAALKPLEEMAKNFKEFTELQTKATAAAAGGPALSADEASKLTHHTTAGTRDLTAAEKTRRDELNNKMEDVKSRVKNLSKREQDSMSTDEIKSVVHLMTESQIKAVKESERRSEKDKDAIESEWHEKASGAALQKANKEIDLLRKISHDLSVSGVTLATVNSNVGTRYSPLVGATIDSGKVEAMINNVNSEMASVNSAIRAALPGVSTVAERQNLNNLQKALKTLEKLDEARSSVPSNVGGEVASGKFKAK